MSWEGFLESRVPDGLLQPRGAWRRLLPRNFGEKKFSVFYFSTFESIFLSRTLFWNDSRTIQPRRGYAGRGWLGLTLSLTEGRRWDKRHRQRTAAGSWLCWPKYVIHTSLNTWIISSIITNRASDCYSEHSKREYHESHMGFLQSCAKSCGGHNCRPTV